MSQNSIDRTLYPHPFSKAYWKQAAAEFGNTKMLIFAALMIALRVALKPLGIPIAADIKINIAFFINAFGAMVFGPVVAIAGAAISDTLGCMPFPQGFYFFPMIFIEIAGSLIFALFLYRARVTVWRVILARFCIDFFVNIVMTTPLMWWYYSIFLPQSTYVIFDVARILKNLVLFPIESLLLTAFLRMVIPPAQKLGYVHSGVEDLEFNARNIVVLAVALVVGVAAIVGYAVNYYNTTSVSSSYSSAERLERNLEMNAWVCTEIPELDEETTVTVVEAGMRKVGDPNLVYTLAIYRLDMDEFNANLEEFEAKSEEEKKNDKKAVNGRYDLDVVRGFSKSKPKNDDSLTKIGTATAIANKKTDEHISIDIQMLDQE